MAKRSTRRQRERASRPAPSSEPGAPASKRQFWIGVLVAAVVLIPLAVVGIVIASGDSDEQPLETASEQVEPTPTVDERSEAERLAEESQTYDQGQVQALTDLAREYSDELDPVVTGLDRTFPIGEPKKLGPIAHPSDVNKWHRTARKVEKAFEDTVSGETGTNVARGALASAVRMVARSVESYRMALRNPELRDELLAMSRKQRDDAIRAWETANVQIDVINIAVGFGHQHPAIPGAAGGRPDADAEG
jgi:hypothetical protein